MWSEVLGVGRIGLQDNFFDLGGHSLLAVQLIARIQTVVDRPLTLMDLFRHPTVEQLAQRLDEGQVCPSPEVVPLREGRDLPPLFCFDPDGTHVQAYRPLALSLEEGRPVYGLSLSHLFAMRWQDVSILKLAERQAAAIRDRQPHGPYHLVGWSNGGVLALAAAQVLERDGEKVAFLGLLDSQPEHALYETQGPTPVEELLAYIRRDRRDAFAAIPESERIALRQNLDRLDEEHRLEAAIQWAREREFLSPRRRKPRSVRSNSDTPWPGKPHGFCRGPGTIPSRPRFTSGGRVRPSRVGGKVRSNGRSIRQDQSRWKPWTGTIWTRSIASTPISGSGRL